MLALQGPPNLGFNYVTVTAGLIFFRHVYVELFVLQLSFLDSTIRINFVVVNKYTRLINPLIRVGP